MADRIKITPAQRKILERASKGRDIYSDLYAGRGMQAATAGRYRVVTNLTRMGLLSDDKITDAGRAAIGIQEAPAPVSREATPQSDALPSPQQREESR